MERIKHILAIISFNQIIVSVFFIFFLVSLFVYQDYGISWDEHRQREIALNNYEYVVNGDDGLESFRDKDYGIAYEMPLFLLERALGLNDCKSIFQTRHLVNHWFFLVMASLFALLIHRLFENKWLALIAFLCLCLHPRIYVHSFVNSKDIPFMGGIILFFYQLRRFMVRPSRSQMVWLGLACVFVINLRIMGVVVLIPVIYYLFYLLRRSRLHKWDLLIFISSVPLLLFLTWPYLWSDPIHNFLSALNNMGDFRWGGSVLFLGKMHLATNKPWFYSLVWIMISTPIIFLIFAGFGLGSQFKQLVVSWKTSFTPKNYLFLTSLYILLGTLLGSILLGADNFDDWRHLYYVYPSIIILVISGIKYVHSKTSKIWIIAPIYLIWLIFNLIKLHPHQQVYFNEMTPKSKTYLRANFDLDYWGLSYKQGLEFIAESDQSNDILVLVENFPGKLNLCSLSEEDRGRIKITESPAEADYFITNYRFHPENYKLSDEVFFVKIQGSRILSVFRIQK